MANQFVLGVDRLDYTKGLRQRVRAIGELFEEGRLDPADVVFMQIATPSRERVDEYRRLRIRVQRLAGRRVPCIEVDDPTYGRVFRTWTFVGRGRRLEATAGSPIEATRQLVEQLETYRRRNRR